MSGNVWDHTIVISKGKLNQMTIISGLASYLNGLTKLKNQVWLPEDAGSGMNAYNLYAWDGSALRNLSNPAHQHNGSSTGGDLQNIYFGNSKVVDTAELLYVKPAVAKWVITNDAGCTTVDDTATTPDSILTTVGTTINTRSRADFHYQKIDFAQRMAFMAWVKFNTLVTNFVWNMGVNCENVGDVTDTVNKIVWEICTSVNANYFIAAANGSTRTGTDTGLVSDTTNERGLKFYYTPAVKIDWQVGPSTSGIKTTSVPSSGVSANRNQVMRTGQKTTIGSAGKSVNWWGPRLIYQVSDILV